ncbi:MAG: septum site-determining protein MinC [Buchnera aphidicola (Meitanaphis flavogallis)]
MKILPLELKGSTLKILVLHLKTNSIVLIRKELNKKIQISPNFFKNLPIIINVEQLSNLDNLDNIRKVIISFDLCIVGISGCYNDVLKNIIVKSGLPILSNNTINDTHRYQSSTDCALSFNKYEKTKIIDFPVRSGQKIYAINSDLIATSNVNAGAEIIADGNVHVYGNMRGRVLAGAKGDITCQIFCIRFFAELVSISGEYLLIDQFFSNFIGQSVRIYIKNKKLKIFKL